MISTLLILLNIWGIVPELSPNTPETFILGSPIKIEIVLNHCNPEEVSLKSTIGNVQKINDSTYLFHPNTAADEAKIKLYYKKVICGSKTISIKAIPEPSIHFTGENNGTIRRSDLDKLGSLLFVFPENVGQNVVVTSFQIFLTDKSGMSIFSTALHGNQLDNRTIEYIKSTKFGSKLTISGIISSTPINGNTRIKSIKEITIVD